MSLSLSGVVNLETLRSVVEALPYGVFWKDRDFIYRGCNDEVAVRHWGVPAASLLGLTDFDLFPAEQARAIRAKDMQVVESGIPALGIIEALKTAAGERWIEINKAPMRAADGKITGVLSTFRDITEQVALQNERMGLIEQLTIARDQAEAASRAKSQFLANMSHELRTPLNAIIGYGEIIRDDAFDANVKADATRLVRAATHLLSVINDVLDLSKIEAGKLSLQFSEFLPITLAEEAIEAVKPMADAKGNILRLEVTSEIGEAWGDRMKLKQCLINLLSNAVKFTERGRVDLRVSVDGADTLKFEVADSGVGISAEGLARLFHPFVQLDGSDTRVAGGTGLGLAISRRLAHLMGGEISVASVLGCGSTFTLSVPCEGGHFESGAPSRRGIGAAGRVSASRAKEPPQTGGRPLTHARTNGWNRRD